MALISRATAAGLQRPSCFFVLGNARGPGPDLVLKVLPDWGRQNQGHPAPVVRTGVEGQTSGLGILEQRQDIA